MKLRRQTIATDAWIVMLMSIAAMMMSMALTTVASVALSSQDPTFLYSKKFDITYNQGDLSSWNDGGLTAHLPVMFLLYFSCVTGAGKSIQVKSELIGYNGKYNRYLTVI